MTAPYRIPQSYQVSAYAATDGRLPTGAANGGDAPGGGATPWVSPTGVLLIDAAGATFTGAIKTQYLYALGFGFEIPTGKTIDGIEAEITRKKGAGVSGGVVDDNSVVLIKNGTLHGDDKASGDAWPASFGAKLYGHATDLWGGSWTAEDCNAANFGIAISADGTGATGSPVGGEVDSVRLRVHYH